MEYTVGGINDTIAAVATPISRAGGGIGIIRISGDQAIPILQHLFRPRKTDSPFEDRKMILGHIIDPHNRRVLDEVLVVSMAAPRTYTRENVVEVHCHGGMRVVSQILGLIASHGARIARPGEFTFRAFMNGRIDLTRAEAVMDLIQAKSRAGLRIAAQQITGSLEKKLQTLLSELTDMSALIEVNIDFPDEELSNFTVQDFRDSVAAIVHEMEKLLASFKTGEKIAEGFHVTIAGLPNVGKSSLMNCLLQRHRSIVAPIPGTTRDYIEETIELNGIAVHLTDTAGIRQSRNVIERESVSRSLEKIRQSDLVLLVLDSSKKLTLQDVSRVMDIVRGTRPLIVLNKEDIRKFDHRRLVEQQFPHVPLCTTSATNGKGVGELIHLIIQTLFDAGIDPEEELILTNARHAEALSKTLAALGRIDELLQCPVIPLTLMAMELGEATTALREILGIEVSDSVLERIFQTFCIGK